MLKKTFISIIIISLLMNPVIVYCATDEGYGEGNDNLGQFTDSFENDDNVSIAINVINNQTLDCMELNYTSGIIGYENFSQYTHIDPDGKVVPDNYNISWTNYERDDAGRTVRDFGVNAIVNFNWSFEFRLSDLEAGDTDSRGIFMVLIHDQTNSVGFATDHYSLIQIVQVGADDTKYEWWMTTLDGTTSNTIGGAHLDVGTVYYCNYYRSGVTKTLDVFTDPEMTLPNRVEHITHNKGTNDYRYLQTIKMVSSGNDPADDSDGYLFELFNTTRFSGGFVTDGYIITEDYLNYTTGNSLTLLTNTSIPDGTSITVQFSNDNVTWVDSEGNIGSNLLIDGFYAIDLRNLNYTDDYKLVNFTGTTTLTPRLYQLREITTNGTAGDGVSTPSEDYAGLLIVGLIIGLIVGIGASRS